MINQQIAALLWSLKDSIEKNKQNIGGIDVEAATMLLDTAADRLMENYGKMYRLIGYVSNGDIYQTLFYSDNLEKLKAAGVDLWENMMKPKIGYQSRITTLAIMDAEFEDFVLKLESHDGEDATWAEFYNGENEEEY